MADRDVSASDEARDAFTEAVWRQVIARAELSDVRSITALLKAVSFSPVPLSFLVLSSLFHSAVIARLVLLYRGRYSSMRRDRSLSTR